MEEFEERFIKPIVSASYPATLAALSLAVLQVTAISGSPATYSLKNTLLTSAAAFLISAFFIFFYNIYPTRKELWTVAAITFLVGLLLSVASVLLLYII